MMNLYEMASALCIPNDMEGARWLLDCLVNPDNRKILDALVEEANKRREPEVVGVNINDAALTLNEILALVDPDEPENIGLRAAQAQLCKLHWWILIQIRGQQRNILWPRSVNGSTRYTELEVLARSLEDSLKTAGIEPWEALG